VKAITQLASGLGHRVVAEGVETEEQASVLTSVGCTLLQGWLVGKPTTADDFERYLRPQKKLFLAIHKNELAGRGCARRSRWADWVQSSGAGGKRPPSTPHQRSILNSFQSPLLKHLLVWRSLSWLGPGRLLSTGLRVRSALASILYVSIFSLSIFNLGLAVVIGGTVALSPRDATAARNNKPLDFNAPVLDVEDRVPVDVPRIPPPGKKSYVQLDAAVDTVFVVGSEFSDTTVNDTDTRLTFEVGAPLSKVIAIGARARIGIRDFHFDGDGQFLDAGQKTGGPFDTLYEPSVTLGFRIKLVEWLDMEIAGRAVSRIEEGARLESGLEGGGSVSFLARYKDRVLLRLGVALGSRFNNTEVNFSPVFRLRVRLHERVWAETSGRGGRLEFTASDRVRIDLFGGIDGGRYRLEDRRDGPGGVGRGSIRLKRSDVGIGTRIKLRKGLKLILEAGAILTQTLEVRDNDGDLFDETETREPAFRGRVSLKWRF